MKAPRPFRLWFAIVGAFSFLGFLFMVVAAGSSFEQALQGIFSGAGLGIGIATCAVGGIRLVASVRDNSLTSDFAVVLFFGVCVCSAFLPALFMLLPEILGLTFLGIKPFAGESGFFIIGVSFIMFGVALLAFMLFLIALFVD